MNPNVPHSSIEPNQQTPMAAPSPPSAVQPGWSPGRVTSQESRRKSPGLAAALSLLPGLGQVYVGYYQDGFINIIVVGSVISLLELDLGPLEPLAGFFLAFFWLYNMVDAARKASLYNQALIGLGPLELPDAATPAGAGTLLGGILLILFGGLAFAHTMFGVSMRWIEDWWPLAIVGIGVYLVYRAWADKKAQAK